MNNCEKKLDALIYALGFDVEENRATVGDMEISEWNNKWRGVPSDARPPRPASIINYKLTKHNNKLVDLNALRHLMPKAIESVFKIENPTPVEVEATLRILGLLNEEI